jgi:hypothetical protein
VRISFLGPGRLAARHALTAGLAAPLPAAGKIAGQVPTSLSAAREGDGAMSPPSDSARLPHPVNDLGGLPGEPIVTAEHELAPWEKRCHATLECLNWRGVMSMEEKRRAVEDLGQAISDGLTYYQKWALAAAHQLLEKGLITQDELAGKMDEVRARERAAL